MRQLLVTPLPAGPVILFDGVCNLCNGYVRFVLKHDRKAVFRFAALQTRAAKDLVSWYHTLDGIDLTTIVLIENGRPYTRSKAVLRMLRGIGGGWALLYRLMLVPAPLRDGAYMLIARTRYRIFGRRKTCMVPTPEVRARFLEWGQPQVPAA